MRRRTGGKGGPRKESKRETKYHRHQVVYDDNHFSLLSEKKYALLPSRDNIAQIKIERFYRLKSKVYEILSAGKPRVFKAAKPSPWHRKTRPKIPSLEVSSTSKSLEKEAKLFLQKHSALFHRTMLMMLLRFQQEVSIVLKPGDAGSTRVRETTSGFLSTNINLLREMVSRLLALSARQQGHDLEAKKSRQPGEDEFSGLSEDRGASKFLHTKEDKFQSMQPLIEEGNDPVLMHIAAEYSFDVHKMKYSDIEFDPEASTSNSELIFIAWTKLPVIARRVFKDTAECLEFNNFETPKKQQYSEYLDQQYSRAEQRYASYRNKYRQKIDVGLEKQFRFILDWMILIIQDVGNLALKDSAGSFDASIKKRYKQFDNCIKFLVLLNHILPVPTPDEINMLVSPEPTEELDRYMDQQLSIILKNVVWFLNAFKNKQIRIPPIFAFRTSTHHPYQANACGRIYRTLVGCQEMVLAAATFSVADNISPAEYSAALSEVYGNISKLYLDIWEELREKSQQAQGTYKASPGDHSVFEGIPTFEHVNHIKFKSKEEATLWLNGFFGYNMPDFDEFKAAVTGQGIKQEIKQIDNEPLLPRTVQRDRSASVPSLTSQHRKDKQDPSSTPRGKASSAGSDSIFTPFSATPQGRKLFASLSIKGKARKPQSSRKKVTKNLDATLNGFGSTKHSSPVRIHSRRGSLDFLNPQKLFAAKDSESHGDKDLACVNHNTMLAGSYSSDSSSDESDSASPS